MYEFFFFFETHMKAEVDTIQIIYITLFFESQIFYNFSLSSEIITTLKLLIGAYMHTFYLDENSTFKLLKV